MTPTDKQVQQAESQRYGNQALRVLPLSGEAEPCYAVLGPARQILGYASGMEEAVQINQEWFEKEAERRGAVRAQMGLVDETSFNPEDLGL